MAERLVLDYANMLAPRLGERGLQLDVLDRMADRFREVYADTEQRRESGELGFLALPYERTVTQEIRTFAEGVGQSFDTIVVLGIGGSALGTLALQQALLPPYWNELNDEQRDYYPRLYVLDNIDPTTIGPLLERLDMRRTLFNVVSKSGSTAETMSQYLIIRDMLRSTFEGDPDGERRHLVFTTDPAGGVLRKLADEEGIATLPVPQTVGGRYSVLSAVGLLPAALVGIDIDALLAGAAAMDERCRTDVLQDNPAALFAALQYAAHTEKNAAIHVMMAYGDRLYGFADWFRQLWAESLGKRVNRAGEEVFVGPTPVKALGPTDQHSQVQLYMEGPFDKTVTILALEEGGTDLVVPDVHPDLDALSYLGGSSLGALLDAERVATTHALATNGRMNMTITLPRANASAVGELIMMLQIATVYAGGFYDVNPLDQPGVELGKQLTYGLMGRKGYDAPATPDDGTGFRSR
ncbi:MAG: glucose-6-phosphate isomerase [Longimicrobiales bacterium]